MGHKIVDPVRDISFKEALNVSLNNYYDLLKSSVGGLHTDEFLQLKLVADPVALSDDDANKGGYRWWSYYNLLSRADHAIVPQAVDDEISISAGRLATVYGDLLNKLIGYVAVINLPSSDQLELADIEKTLDSLQQNTESLLDDDLSRWEKYAKRHHYEVGDQSRYAQWAQYNGNWDKVKKNQDEMKLHRLRRRVILNKRFPDPEDIKVRDALEAYDNIFMQLGYPAHPDYLYSDGQQFSVNYLSTFAGTTNALFDSRRSLDWTMPLKTVLSTNAGHFKADFNKTTAVSTSMTTDWGASGSGSYYFISASCSASEHTAIQEDFDKMINMQLSAEAAFRLDITYGAWFDPTIFTVKHIKDNPQDFMQFFGPNGSLLYYPLGLILVRGFSVVFESAQNWKYDYDHSFSASAGGGFNCGLVSFGASGSYSEHTHTHKVDQSGTTLTLTDDVNTIRFVGLAVAKNAEFATYCEKARARVHDRS